MAGGPASAVVGLPQVLAKSTRRNRDGAVIGRARCSEVRGLRHLVGFRRLLGRVPYDVGAPRPHWRDDVPAPLHRRATRRFRGRLDLSASSPAPGGRVARETTRGRDRVATAGVVRRRSGAILDRAFHSLIVAAANGARTRARTPSLRRGTHPSWRATRAVVDETATRPPKIQRPSAAVRTREPRRSHASPSRPRVRDPLHALATESAIVLRGTARS